METIIIQIPDGCEVQIVKKEEKKEPAIKTYQDLTNKCITIEGSYIDFESTILPTKRLASHNNKLIAASEKVAKSMLAMAMISQLMPYYGGEITDEEWESDMVKYVIIRRDKTIDKSRCISFYHFLAFRTEELRDEFVKYNEQLVKDYLMID